MKYGFQGQGPLEAAPLFFFFFVRLEREKVVEAQVKFCFQVHGALEAAPRFFFLSRMFVREEIAEVQMKFWVSRTWISRSSAFVLLFLFNA